MADDWGCGDEFAGSFGSSKTLCELVEGLATKKPEVSTSVESFPFPSAADSENVPVQVVPCFLKTRPISAPKILKKKSTINRLNKEPNLKRVTFEVEQLLVREGDSTDRDKARERLVVSLGGEPAKQEAVNYKVLKRQREEEKAMTVEDRLNGITDRVMKKKKKK